VPPVAPESLAEPSEMMLPKSHAARYLCGGEPVSATLATFTLAKTREIYRVMRRRASRSDAINFCLPLKPDTMSIRSHGSTRTGPSAAAAQVPDSSPAIQSRRGTGSQNASHRCSEALAAAIGAIGAGVPGASTSRRTVTLAIPQAHTVIGRPRNARLATRLAAEALNFKVAGRVSSAAVANGVALRADAQPRPRNAAPVQGH